MPFNPLITKAPKVVISAENSDVPQQTPVYHSHANNGVSPPNNKLNVFSDKVHCKYILCYCLG